MYVPAEDGSFISEKTARIAELIKDYDHRLELRWIPPNRRQPGEPEFAIIEKNDNGQEYVAFLIENEDYVDERLLGRIYAADNKDKSVGAEAEAHNKAIRDLIKKEQQEKDAMAADLALSMIKSPFHTYRHNGRKIDL
jgi:hypothetical protein